MRLHAQSAERSAPVRAPFLPAAGLMTLRIERHYLPFQNSLLISFWGFVLTSVKYPDSTHLSTVFQSVAKNRSGQLMIGHTDEQAFFGGKLSRSKKGKEGK